MTRPSVERSTTSGQGDVPPTWRPEIQLLIVASPPTDDEAFAGGEIVEYTFEVANVGDVRLEHVAVGEISFFNGAGVPVALDAGPTPPAGFAGILESGEVALFTGTYTVTDADVAASGAIRHAAIASGTAPAADGDPLPPGVTVTDRDVVWVPLRRPPVVPGNDPPAPAAR